MSGSGGNAFLDLLRALLPPGAPAALTWIPAALLSIASAAVFVAIAAVVGVRAEQRFARRSAGEPWTAALVRGARADAAHLLTCAGVCAALAAYPWAPHVFFADLDLGAFAALALLALATVDRAAAEPGSPGATARAVASSILVAAALLVGVLAAGSANWIEASRLQSHSAGLGWAAFTNPFALVALFVVLGAEVLADPGRESASAAEHVRLFLVSALAAAFLLGGFESPLTWGLRRSLGEDPGFLNHAVLPDGTTELRIAVGGLAFQLVCAATLLAKAALGVLAVHALRAARPRWRRLPASLFAYGKLTSLALAALIGASVWERLSAP